MNSYIWTIIIGGAIVTAVPRVLPITLLSRITLPKKAISFLNYIPIAILSALVVSQLMITNDQLDIREHFLEIIATMPTLYIAIKKNNLLLTVLVGMATIALLRLGSCF